MSVDLRVVKTRERLHESLIALLKEMPLEKIKISVLCQRAQINRGTFYLHYESIDALFADFFEQIIADLREAYLEPLRTKSPLKIKELDPKTVRIFHHIKKYESFYRIVFSKNVPLAYYYMLLEQITLNLQQNTKATHVDNDYFIAYQANAIIGLALQWAQRDFQETAEELSEILVKILRSKSE
ncbi:TetR-like C-terminal domain-containing protein [Metasolibacillus meyeri]|uniref:TetR-like C-terminal domain-containing protein n=1 Tax=Metasolibacillus meyeri TaxID=1071052 RepID=A0AAW9NZ84_9BACL|nr:TetR-like C-terminal domain-containing protein [Metasolibacillus meyeri]MEC1180565.1 TetR-like C-terminal domain-containing protein [Metasolibacillus meyeri]